MPDRLEQLRRCGHSPRRRRGAILVAVMWAIVILTGMVIVFARSMRAELATAGNRLSSDQVAAIERGAEQYVLRLVYDSNGDPTAVTDAPAEQMPVGDGYFWIIKPDPENERAWNFGVADEAAKINIQSATEDQLINLPGMEVETVDGIIDWRDRDNEPRMWGAESDVYQQRPDPYEAKNDFFESLEELRLVNGMTDEILYGYDLNHDGVISDLEQQTGGTGTMFNTATAAGRGILPYITIYSIQGGRTREQRYLNDDDDDVRDILRDRFGRERGDEIWNQARPQRPFRNVFDFAIKGNMTREELAEVIDSFYTSRSRWQMGMVNVNTAPWPVLKCLGLSEADAQALVEARGQSTGEQGIAWVLDALPNPEAIVEIGGRITSKSYQFSADIVAVTGDGRAFKRVRIVVDNRRQPARIVYRRDLTSLGWPLPPEIRDSLRNGQGPGPSIQGRGGGMRSGGLGTGLN